MKWIKFTFICLFIFILSSCTTPNNGSDQGDKDNTNATNLDEVEAWIIENVNTFIIDEGPTLPTSYLDTDVTIIWTSSNEKILNNEGKIIKRDTKAITQVDLSYEIKNENDQVKTGTIKTFVYPRTFDYVSSKFKAQLPERLAESVDYLETEFEDVFKVTWTSSDPEVLTNEGIYIRPKVDTPVTINYRVSVINEQIYKDYSYEIIVLSGSDDEKISFVSDWIENELIPDLNIDSDISLPTTHPDHGTTITWKTSDKNIITTDGKVTRYVFDRYVELSCKIELGSKVLSKTYWFKVKALDTSKMTEKEILENFIKAIAVEDISQVYFHEYLNITYSFNTLKFFDNKWEEQIEWIAPFGKGNRPGTKQTSTEFVVVHDTANNNKDAGGAAHARYVENGGGGTSFQYTVGNDGIYHLIPNDEVAYHAGDGTGQGFELFDTGVKAYAERPHVTIDESGYFAFNGVVGKIALPKGATINSKITPSGLIVEVGPNGNYWLNANYFNKDYKYISNYGGNLNSIGIETCVDQESDYHKTLRYNEDLVARLLIENNLDVTRVIQHNNTSGKYCPAAMITANYWQIFRDAVSLEKFGMETFEGLTFEWISHSDVLSNDGYISLKLGDVREVSYSVVVKRGEQVIYTQDFITKIIK